MPGEAVSGVRRKEEAAWARRGRGVRDTWDLSGRGQPTAGRQDFQKHAAWPVLGTTAARWPCGAYVGNVYGAGVVGGTVVSGTVVRWTVVSGGVVVVEVVVVVDGSVAVVVVSA
jgi:hypothetical protein